MVVGLMESWVDGRESDGVVGLIRLCVLGAMDLAVVVCGGCRWIWLSWARCSNFLCCLWLQPCKWIVSGGDGGGFFFFFL